MVTQPRRLRALALLAASAILSSLAFATPIAASADTAPATSSVPATVSSDALPTVQVNGVVWTQLVVGNTVYVGGSFTNAYPAGAAAGTALTARANMLAYNLTTGALVTTFAPRFNAQVRALAASPDGSIIYAGGNFTQVSGVNEYRTVALNAATGAVITTFRATTDAAVTSLAATSTTLYIGGAYSSLNGVQRMRVAAVSAKTGVLTTWKPVLPDGYVRGIVVSTDGTKVVLGGSFSSVNGATAPGRGLAMVDASTGRSNLPFAVGKLVQDYGTNSSIESLSSDGTNIYGSGYVYGTPGNLEGAFSASWNGGTINWIEDCHGDTYSVARLAGVVYTASHAHYCGSVPGGFPQTAASASAAIHQHAVAFSAAPAGTLLHNTLGNYADWGGQPAPSLLRWLPDLATGTITGLNQAAWSVTTSASGYVLYGGEFPSVNGKAQAGLVRFAVPSIAPNHDGPRIGGSSWVPTAVSTASGSVRVSWLTNWDRDNENLTYALYRQGTSAPIYTTTKASAGFWDRPYLTYVDTGRAVGSTVQYSVKATDPWGNTTWSSPVSALVGSSNPRSYASSVISSGAMDYWRFGEASGSTVYDWAGGAPLTAGSGVTRGAASALAGDPNPAASFSGTSTGSAATRQMVKGPNTFSIEAWFKTTSTSGGKIVGFGNLPSGTSTTTDRHIYLDTNGTLHFGVSSGGQRILSSGSGYNNGKWHYVVGTVSPSGMVFYVDGKQVGLNSAVTAAGYYWGYWRIGGDAAWNGTTWFHGSVDEVAVSPTALTASQVASRYQAGTVASTSTPTASMTATTSGLAVNVDGSSSTDSGSTISSYTWSFGDGATGTGVTATHTYAASGTYPVTLTVRDALGATSTTSRSVTVTTVLQSAADSFSRTVTGGLGTADSGGAWSTSGGSSSLSVSSGAARFSGAAGITLTGILPAVSLGSADTQATVALPALPVGGSVFASLVGRRVSTDDYSGRLTIAPTGALTLAVLHGGVALKSAGVAGITMTPGEQLRLRLQVIGTNPTTVQARVWVVGTTEPTAWQVVATDATASMQTAGSVGLRTYTGSGVTNGPVVTLFDDFSAGAPR